MPSSPSRGAGAKPGSTTSTSVPRLSEAAANPAGPEPTTITSCTAGAPPRAAPSDEEERRHQRGPAQFCEGEQPRRSLSGETGEQLWLDLREIEQDLEALAEPVPGARDPQVELYRGE